MSYASGSAVLYVSDTGNHRIMKFGFIGVDLTGVVVAGYQSGISGSGIFMRFYVFFR